MTNDREKLTPQEAPEKNTDAAFVKVGSDGKPQISENNSLETQADTQPKEGTLADR